MPTHAYRMFIEQAHAHERQQNLDAAWACLEAAHIVGQRRTRLHAGAHLHMLRLALRTRNQRELAGQAARLLAALCMTWLWVPAGNSGRAHVSALQPADIPSDLQALIDASQAPRDAR